MGIHVKNGRIDVSTSDSASIKSLSFCSQFLRAYIETKASKTTRQSQAREQLEIADGRLKPSPTTNTMKPRDSV
jgi:hypothetical protein